MPSCGCAGYSFRSIFFAVSHIPNFSRLDSPPFSPANPLLLQPSFQRSYARNLSHVHSVPSLAPALHSVPSLARSLSPSPLSVSLLLSLFLCFSLSLFLSFSFSFANSSPANESLVSLRLCTRSNKSCHSWAYYIGRPLKAFTNPVGPRVCPI